MELRVYELQGMKIAEMPGVGWIPISSFGGRP